MLILLYLIPLAICSTLLSSAIFKYFNYTELILLPPLTFLIGCLISLIMSHIYKEHKEHCQCPTCVPWSYCLFICIFGLGLTIFFAMIVTIIKVIVVIP